MHTTQPIATDTPAERLEALRRRYLARRCHLPESIVRLLAELAFATKEARP